MPNEDPQPPAQYGETDPPGVRDERTDHQGGGTYTLNDAVGARRSLLRSDHLTPDTSMPNPPDKTLGDADRGHEGVGQEHRIDAMRSPKKSGGSGDG